MAKKSALELKKAQLNDLGSGDGKLALQPLGQRSMFWRPVYLEQSAWLEHIPFAFWLIEAHKPQVFVELGTHYGVSYFAFCQAVQRLGLDMRCFAVDTWKGDEHAGFYGEEVFEQVKAHNEAQYSSFSRLVRSTFDEALEYFEDNSIDLLHIDGLHTFEAVQHDFESWLPKLSSRAIVLMHDTNVRERGFSVAKFFESLKEQYPHFEFLHGHGLGTLGVGTEQVELIERLFQANEANYTRQAVHEVFGRLGRACADALDVAKQKRVIKTLGSAVEKQKKQLDNFKQELETTKKSLNHRDKELNDTRSQLTLQIEQHAAQRGQLAERVNLLQELRTDLKDEVARLQNRIEQSTNELQSRTDELYQLSLNNQQHQQQVQEHKNTLEKHAKDLNDKTQEVKKYREELNTYKKSLQTQKEASQGQEAKITSLKETIQQYKVETETYQQAMNSSNEELEKCKLELNRSKQALKDQQAALQGQETQISLFKETVQQYENGLEESRNKLTERDQIIKSLKHERDLNAQAYERDMSELLEECINLKEQLEESKKKEDESHKASEHKLGHLQQQLHDQTIHSAELEEERGQLVEKLTNLSKKEEERIIEFANLAKRLEEHEAHLKSKENEVGGKRRHVQDLDRELSAKVEALGSTEKQLAAEKTKVKTIQKQEEQELAKLQAENQEQEKELQTLSKRLENRFQEIAKLTQMLDERDHAIAARDAELHLADLKVTELNKSLSWRFTAPMRELKRAIKDKLNKENRSIKNEIILIAQTGLFDIEWYVQKYPDVAKSSLDPIKHYLLYGASEGRNPSSTFDTNEYLEKNKDVAHSGMNPLVHFIKQEIQKDATRL